MNEVLDSVRILLCLVFLIYASWSDFKKRGVGNRVWVILAPLAFILTYLQFFLFSRELLKVDLSYPYYGWPQSFGATVILSTILFYARVFSETDAKAFTCLSLALPFYPTKILQPYSSVVSPFSQWYFTITVFSNAVISAGFGVLFGVLYMVARNFSWKQRTKKNLFEGVEKESKCRKILVLLCGYKTNIAELEKKEYFYPLEDFYWNERKLQ